MLLSGAQVSEHYAGASACYEGDQEDMLRQNPVCFYDILSHGHVPHHEPVCYTHSKMSNVELLGSM